MFDQCVYIRVSGQQSRAQRSALIIISVHVDHNMIFASDNDTANNAKQELSDYSQRGP
jgi:hypothetical protein